MTFSIIIITHVYIVFPIEIPHQRIYTYYFPLIDYSFPYKFKLIISLFIIFINLFTIIFLDDDEKVIVTWKMKNMKVQKPRAEEFKE